LLERRTIPSQPRPTASFPQHLLTLSGLLYSSSLYCPWRVPLFFLSPLRFSEHGPSGLPVSFLFFQQNPPVFFFWLFRSGPPFPERSHTTCGYPSFLTCAVFLPGFCGSFPPPPTTNSSFFHTNNFFGPIFLSVFPPAEGQFVFCSLWLALLFPLKHQPFAVPAWHEYFAISSALFLCPPFFSLFPFHVVVSATARPPWKSVCLFFFCVVSSSAILQQSPRIYLSLDRVKVLPFFLLKETPVFLIRAPVSSWFVSF